MKHLISIVLLLTHWQLFAFNEVNSTFYFDSDIDTLNQLQYLELLSFIDKTTATKQYKEVYIVGFTDADGTNQYNIDLSKRRADFVSNLLVKNGLPFNLIDKNFKGEENPVAKNNTEINKSKNRRVEITMRMFDIQKAADIVKEINGNPEQVFILDNTKENSIEGKNGIRFIFPPFCFDINRNKKSDFQNIKIVLTEVTNLIQGFFSNVLAESNNQLLQSGGIFKITAYLNDVELKMKKSMNYIVQINNKNIQNDMTVFVPTTLQQDGLVRWENSSVAFEKSSSFKGVRPFLELDKELVKQWKLHPTKDSLLKYYVFKLPIPPTIIKYPTKPFPPFEPKITSSKYKLPWYKKVFLSKSKRKRIIQENYNNDLEIYLRSKAIYETKLTKYAIDTAIFASKQIKYKLEYNAYRDSLHMKANEADMYRFALSENSFIKSFEYAKYFALYKLEKKNLYSHNVYGELLAQCNKISRAKDIHPSYSQQFSDYAKNLKAICKYEFPNETFMFSFSSDHINQMYPYSYLKQFTALMKSDSIMFAHITKCEDKLREEEIRLGLFDPKNFKVYYEASLDNFGWINCDRLAKYKQEEMFTLQIPNYKMEDKNVFAILKNINSQISIPLANNNMHKIALPKNTEIVIVAIGLDKNLTPMYAKENIKSNGDINLKLDFKTGKLSDIKEMIQSI